MTKWADEQKARYDRLKRLDQEVKKAEGQLQVQSYQAQYSSEMVKEMIQLNENMRSFIDYMVSLNEKNLEQSMIEQAQSEANQDWQPPKVKKWNRYFLD